MTVGGWQPLALAGKIQQQGGKAFLFDVKEGFVHPLFEGFHVSRDLKGGPFVGFLETEDEHEAKDGRKHHHKADYKTRDCKQDKAHESEPAKGVGFFGWFWLFCFFWLCFQIKFLPLPVLVSAC